MKTRQFGPTGREVPVIGFGTWNLERTERAVAVSAIRAAIDSGAVHIDTAELYGHGKVEELVAEAIAGRRDEVFLVSKVLPQHASRQQAVRACEASLRRLNTDRLDCYLLHWESQHRLQETFAAFDQLQSEGKILSWGVSNFDEERIEEAVRIAGPGRVACNQVLYHLTERAIEHAVIPRCEEHGIAVVAYSPFGSGDFPGPESPGGGVLAKFAKKHGANRRQVALAFLTRREGTFAIPMSTDPAHIAQNSAAAEIQLDSHEIDGIDRAFPLGRRTKGVPTL
jgi:diketogulonate reductase-like aldo/keto reductase